MKAPRYTRRFSAARYPERCRADITLRDGSGAQCMRKCTVGELCTQHAKMADAFHCEYCGGNDEAIPDHCEDCARPRP